MKMLANQSQELKLSSVMLYLYFQPLADAFTQNDLQLQKKNIHLEWLRFKGLNGGN